MAEKKYDLVLTGRTLPGHAREAVAAALVKLMRLTESRAGELLAGRETVIKRGVDEAALAPYVAALKQAGAELRTNEISVASPAPAAPVTPETIKCPACGAEQPKRNLCRQCGADMARLLAAKEEERKTPAAVPALNPAARTFQALGYESPLDRPFYRRNLLIELFFFFVLNIIWSYFTMKDAARSKAMRVVGGLFFVCGALLIVLRALVLTGVIDLDNSEDIAVLDAASYTFKVGSEVERYAVANQRFPNRTASVELPEPRPQAVKEVLIGPEGRIEVRLGDHLKHSADGVFVLTPRVESGALHWTCEYQNIKLDRQAADIFNRCN